MSQEKQEYLIGKNVLPAGVFVIWSLIIYLGFLCGTSQFWESVESDYGTLSRKGGFLLAIMPIVLLVLSGLLTGGMKARLVFWRWRYPLPGHRAFSELAPKDARIDMRLLKAKHGVMPKEPRAQNTAWYGIYRRYQNATIVKQVHRRFLLARDLAVNSLVLAIGGAVGLALAGAGVLAVLFYSLVMMLHYLAFAIAARNYGIGFVCNVLVEYVADRSDPTAS